MPRNYNDISDDEMLNYEDAQTATMDRYRRIMQHRSNEAMTQLSSRLQGVMETIYRASQLAQQKADEAIASASSAAQRQQAQQKAMTVLTIALVVSTVLYTIINGVSAYQAFRGNRIQAEIAAIAAKQVAAAEQANTLQRESLKSDVRKASPLAVPNDMNRPPPTQQQREPGAQVRDH